MTTWRFERKLYVIRRRAENAIRYAGLAGGDFFYVPEHVLPHPDLQRHADAAAGGRPFIPICPTRWWKALSP